MQGKKYVTEKDGIGLSDINFHYDKTNWKEKTELREVMNWNDIL